MTPTIRTFGAAALGAMVVAVAVLAVRPAPAAGAPATGDASTPHSITVAATALLPLSLAAGAYPTIAVRIDRLLVHTITVGGLAVFSRKWALGADGKPKRFDEIVSEYPITSGPYTIAKADSGRRLEFKRNPDYWAGDLGIRRGMFNWDRVVYRYYGDQAVAREACFEIVRSGVGHHAPPEAEISRSVVRHDARDRLVGLGVVE